MRNSPNIHKNTNTGLIWLFIFINVFVGSINIVMFPGEVSMSLKMLGGASAIFFFSARTHEEKCLSLHSLFINTLSVCFVHSPHLDFIFIAEVCFIYIYILIYLIHDESSYSKDLLFVVVIFFRIIFYIKVKECGLGLVTELLFFRLYSIFFEFIKIRKSSKVLKIEPLLYLIPLFGLALYLNINLDYDLNEIKRHILLIFSAASLVYFISFSDTIMELLISGILYIMSNFPLGYTLADSVMTFFLVSSLFLISIISLVFFFILKAKRDKKSLAYILLSNNREGIHNNLVILFLIIGNLLTQLNPESAALPLYSNWVWALGIQIGYLTLFHYYFRR